MMNLYLVRHGEARTDSGSLTQEGIEQAGRTADWAAEKMIPVDEIRHSGKMRAEQTASIIAKKIAPKDGTASMAGLKPDDNFLATWEQLEAEGVLSLMLVGHNPFMGLLAHHLLTQSTGARTVTFKNGTIAWFQKTGDAWSLKETFSP